MIPYLLDVNVLLALAWPSHVHHQPAHDWFSRNARAGFRTCPLTETAFVRISSNPQFMPDAVAPADAVMLLDRITAFENHEFWPDDLRLSTALRDRFLAGHRQITDAYLVALAVKHRGRFATFDRAVLSLGHAPGIVELLHKP